MKLKGMKVEEAIQKVIEHSANAVFIVSGDIFRGNIRRCPNKDKAKFIYLRGDISFWEAVSDIHSNEFMELRLVHVANLAISNASVYRTARNNRPYPKTVY